MRSAPRFYSQCGSGRTGYYINSRKESAPSALAVILFAVCLLGASLYCFERPTAGPDSLVYVSILGRGNQADFREAARVCDRQVPGPHNGCDPEDSNLSREIDSYTSDEFATFLRFYEVKPLYTWTAQLFHQGIHLPAFVALRLVSSLSYLVIGTTLAFWLRNYLSVPAACLCALLIVALPPVISIGKFLLPDAFSTALMLQVIYIVLYKTRRLGVQLPLLAILPLARPDNILFMALWGAMLVLRATVSPRTRVLRLAMFAVGCALLNTVLRQSTHALSYTVLFNHSFISFTRPSTYAQLHLTLGDYVHSVSVFGVKTVILYLPLPVLFSVLALADASFWRPMRDLVAVSMTTVLARLLLFPAQEERYYTWFLVIAAVGAAAAVGGIAESSDSWFGRCTRPAVTSLSSTRSGAGEAGIRVRPSTRTSNAILPI